MDNSEQPVEPTPSIRVRSKLIAKYTEDLIDQINAGMYFDNEGIILVLNNILDAAQLLVEVDLDDQLLMTNKQMNNLNWSKESVDGSE